MKIYYFTAAWCGPCKALRPWILSKESKIKDSGASFEIIDVDANRSLAAQYGVMSIPTLIVIKGDVPPERAVGAQDIMTSVTNLISESTS